MTSGSHRWSTFLHSRSSLHLIVLESTLEQTSTQPTMAPSLSVSAGPSTDSLQPLAVNHDELPFEIESPKFRGRATVRIKSFTGQDPSGVEHRKDAPYFNDQYRKGITWSIQVQGRFLEAANTDDIVFGNQFEKPIRDHLPYGTSLALQFVKVVDPNMQHDLYADKPWAFSPYIATMNHFNIQRLPGGALQSSGSAKDDFKAEGYPEFPSPAVEAGQSSSASQSGYVIDSTAALVSKADKDSEGKSQLEDQYSKLMDRTTFLGLDWPADQGSANDHEAQAARKKLFSSKANRQAISFTPQDVFTSDFAQGYIDFNSLYLSIPFSGGLSFDLKKYWDGQPVTYVCKNKSTGDVYFVVQFNIQDLHS